MATIDASIPLGVRPMQIESPVNQLAKVLQIKEAQQGQQMNQLKMDEYQRGIEDQNALRSALSAPGADPYNVLLQRGKVKEATDFLKGKADVAKTTADTDKTKIEAAHKRVDLMGQTLGWVRQNPTVENATQAIQYLVDNGVMPPEKGQEALAKFSANPNPQAIAQFAEMGFRAALQAKEQLPKFETRDAGGTLQTQSIDPVTGKVAPVNTIQKTQSPDAVLQATTSTENNKRSVGAQYAIAGASREQAAATRDAARISADAKQRTDVELKLQDDYRAESKGWAETSTAMKKVMGAIQTADKNPGSALAAGTGFMKLLDPNSVVRETELGMALNASGWFDRATNIANTLQNGRIMTATQKENLKKAANDLFEEAKKAQLEVDAAYKKRAKDYGLDAGRIIVDRGQNGPVGAAASNPEVDELVKKYGGR